MSTKHQETRPEPQEKVPETPPAVSEAAGEPESKDSPIDDTDSGRIAALEAELGLARQELSSVNDKYLRKLAEDVNFRKRMVREKEDGQRFALTALLGDLIPVLDDLDRAIASAETQKDYVTLHDGVALIKRQLGSLLQSKYGLQRIDSLGKTFDPNHHEAVAMVQGGPEDGDEAVVAEEFLPGYGLHDRIIRTAKVRVRMPAPKNTVSDGQEAVPEAPKDAN